MLSTNLKEIKEGATQRCEGEGIALAKALRQEHYQIRRDHNRVIVTGYYSFFLFLQIFHLPSLLSSSFYFSCARSSLLQTGFL